MIRPVCSCCSMEILSHMGAGEPSFPSAPKNGDTYEYTDASGKYTKYQFNSQTSTWVIVETILPEVVAQSSYSFLPDEPVDDQMVSGTDGLIYTYDAGSATWEGELILPGIKPLFEYSNKCQGLENVWNNYPSNEVMGYVTKDGQLLVTAILSYNGGSSSGTYYYQGTTYYPYPDSQGAPINNYEGMIHAAGFYFIPVVASAHTHTPCRNDGTDGVSQKVSDDDISEANMSPYINHWVIGCGAIAQYNGDSANFFNAQHGDLSNLCNSIK